MNIPWFSCHYNLELQTDVHEQYQIHHLYNTVLKSTTPVLISILFHSLWVISHNNWAWKVVFVVLNTDENDAYLN